MDRETRREMSEMRTKREVQRRTILLMVLCGIVVFIPVMIKLFSIMIVNHDRYEGLAVDQQTSEITVSASRGFISDRNGNVLALSADVETVFISPKQIIEDEQDQLLIAEGLSEILETDRDGIIEKMEDTKSMYKVIRRKVEKDMADEVRAFINENELTGIYLVADSKRYYPYGSLASHIIGFVGTDNDGLEGTELLYDEYLTGTNGKVITAKNGAGTEMLYTYETYYDAESGNNLKTTLDTTIQYYLRKHLEAAVQDYDIQNGAAAIAMDPNTGEILGMVTLGDFDPNSYDKITDERTLTGLEEYKDDTETYETMYSQALRRIWRNKAVADTYEPGSTFKIITLSIGLEEGAIGLNDSYYCGGSTPVKGREPDDPVRCWKLAGHGSQTLTQAAENSCNVAFVNMGLKIGADTMWDYYDAFGLFEKTGIDLIGESSSIWWSRDVFCDKDNYAQLAAASFGQTFTITPLQLITAVSACVNGGRLMKPYVVRQMLNSDGTTAYEREPSLVRQVISAETSEKVRTILEQVVGDSRDGTGRNAAVPGYRIGGKTGTSEKVSLEAQTGEKEYIVSFIGFAPADKPRIALLVFLDTPSSKSGIYISGGQMAAPVVGNMLADILPYMGIEAQYSAEELAGMDVSMPQLTGLDVSEAARTLRDARLKYRSIGEGDIVTSQLPEAGCTIAAGSEVILYFDREPSRELETMPELSGMSYEQARDTLSYYGIYIRTGSLVTDAAAQKINTQSVPAGQRLGHGTVVEVTLVSGDSSLLGRY